MDSVVKMLNPVVKVVRNNINVVNVILVLVVLCSSKLPTVMNGMMNSNIGVAIVAAVLILLATEVKDNVFTVLVLLALYEMIKKAGHFRMYGNVKSIQSSQNRSRGANANLSDYEYNIEGFEACDNSCKQNKDQLNYQLLN